MLIKLDKSIASILPIFSLKITVSYDGIKKKCKSCSSYHKTKIKCGKKSLRSYIEEFNELNNPCFPLELENAFEDKFVFKHE